MTQKNELLPPAGWFLLAVLAFTLFFLAMFVSFARAEDKTQVIAEVIAAEAAGEGETGMRAVACVIANRAKAQGKTPFAIVTARNQFYGYTAKNRHKLYLWVKSVADKLAKEIMTLKDITNGALYFRRPDEPKFRWCKIETYRYKNHIFYK